MSKYSVPYGTTQIEFTLPEGLTADAILPPETVTLPLDQVQSKIEAALSDPLGGEALETFRNARSVAIAINDKTRPVPYELLLPPLLRRLEQVGIPRSAICLFIATGTHIPMLPPEYPRILPAEIFENYAVVSHNCDDEANLLFLGNTPRGTPVFVNRGFYQADLKIVTGNIEPHHFAGFSGGAKTASIGLCGRQTIDKNHSWLLDPQSMIGIYEENPLRQDIEDIGDQISIDYALNFVMSGEHEIAEVLFGDPRLVMQTGIPVARRICQTPVDDRYDLAIVSPGGQPKDINLYQAQKAMTHAALLLRQGGTLILAAACPEGSGNALYEAYMVGMTSHEAVLEKFRKDGFKMGPHKGYQIARITAQFNLILVSELPVEKMQNWLLPHADSLQAAVDRALAQLPPNPRIAILAHATHTIPIVQA